MTTLGPEVGYLAALVGGVLALLSPCSALLLPSFFAYAFDGAGRLATRTGVFYLGLVTTLIPLGITASTVTRLIRANQESVLAAGGLVVVALGVLQIFGRGFALLPAAVQGWGRGSVYVLGLVYGLTGFCTGPILGSILVLAAVAGEPVRGGVLLALYALGMAVPLFVLAMLWERFDLGGRGFLRGRVVQVGRLRLHTSGLLSGSMLVVLGLLLAFGGASLVDSPWLAELGGRVEVWVNGLDRRIADGSVVLPLLAVAAWWGWRAWRSP